VMVSYIEHDAVAIGIAVLILYMSMCVLGLLWDWCTATSPVAPPAPTTAGDVEPSNDSGVVAKLRLVNLYVHNRVNNRYCKGVYALSPFFMSDAVVRKLLWYGDDVVWCVYPAMHSYCWWIVDSLLMDLVEACTRVQTVQDSGLPLWISAATILKSYYLERTGEEIDNMLCVLSGHCLFYDPKFVASSDAEEYINNEISQYRDVLDRPYLIHNITFPESVKSMPCDGGRTLTCTPSGGSFEPVEHTTYRLRVEESKVTRTDL
jgi:hypothetical protein